MTRVQSHGRGQDRGNTTNVSFLKMPKPTRTTVVVAITFAVVAAYGACVTALATSMYSTFVVMPFALFASIPAIVVAALGLMHLVMMRWAISLAPSHTFCLVLLLLDVVCVSVLLGLAVDGVVKTTSAVETAPKLTTYQHRMEAFFASDKGRQYNYTDSLLDFSPFYGPSNPMDDYYDAVYPRDAAQTFDEAYCVSEGRHFCSAFPLVQTIVFPGIWNNPNVTAEVKRNLSTLPATLVNVIVTASTTLDSFCANVTNTYKSSWSSLTILGSFEDRMALWNDPDFKFQKDIYELCSGCAALSNATTNHAALQTWIHDTCPMTEPKPSGAACIGMFGCIGTSSIYKDTSCFDRTYRSPSYDVCFGHTLMSVARNYDRAVAIVSGVLLLLLLVLSVRVWVVRRVQKYQDALREAAVQSPVDNA